MRHFSMIWGDTKRDEIILIIECVYSSYIWNLQDELERNRKL